MKKSVFVTSFAMVAIAASASQSFAYYPVTYFRCTADQLIGHPSSQATSPESRTGYGRRVWAQTANAYWKFNAGNNANANRYWLPSLFNLDVANAIDADIDLYPVYINNNTPNGDLWVGPGPSNATYFGTTFTTIAGLHFGEPGGTNPDLPAGIAVDALCEAGCYSPEQQVRFGDSNVPVAQAQASGQRSVTTLTPNATLDSLEFMQNSIGRWMVDIAAANQTIITLRMKSGGELRVTTEHPLVTSEGVMKRAEDLVVGESLVRDNGASDPVVSMSSKTEFTKVYNLQPTTTDLTSNILVAQGYLSGSVRYQNEYVKYLNRVLLRNNIPSSAIVRSTPRGTAKLEHN
jgi:hypothetical protein